MTAILISASIYCFLIYIECLVIDSINKDNNYGLVRFVLSILISILLGVIYYIN